MIIIPIKWLFVWEYTLFSDKPISFNSPKFIHIYSMVPMVQKFPTSTGGFDEEMGCLLTDDDGINGTSTRNQHV